MHVINTLRAAVNLNHLKRYVQNRGGVLYFNDVESLYKVYNYLNEIIEKVSNFDIDYEDDYVLEQFENMLQFNSIRRYIASQVRILEASDNLGPFNDPEDWYFPDKVLRSFVNSNLTYYVGPKLVSLQQVQKDYLQDIKNQTEKNSQIKNIKNVSKRHGGFPHPKFYTGGVVPSQISWPGANANLANTGNTWAVPVAQPGNLRSGNNNTLANVGTEGISGEWTNGNPNSGSNPYSSIWTNVVFPIKSGTSNCPGLVATNPFGSDGWTYTFSADTSNLTGNCDYGTLNFNWFIYQGTSPNNLNQIFNITNNNEGFTFSFKAFGAGIYTICLTLTNNSSNTDTNCEQLGNCCFLFEVSGLANSLPCCRKREHKKQFFHYGGGTPSNAMLICRFHFFGHEFFFIPTSIGCETVNYELKWRKRHKHWHWHYRKKRAQSITVGVLPGDGSYTDKCSNGFIYPFWSNPMLTKSNTFRVHTSWHPNISPIWMSEDESQSTHYATSSKGVQSPVFNIPLTDCW